MVSDSLLPLDIGANSHILGLIFKMESFRDTDWHQPVEYTITYNKVNINYSFIKTEVFTN